MERGKGQQGEEVKETTNSKPNQTLTASVIQEYNEFYEIPSDRVSKQDRSLTLHFQNWGDEEPEEPVTM